MEARRASEGRQGIRGKLASFLQADASSADEFYFNKFVGGASRSVTLYAGQGVLILPYQARLGGDWCAVPSTEQLSPREESREECSMVDVMLAYPTLITTTSSKCGECVVYLNIGVSWCAPPDGGFMWLRRDA